MSVDRDGLPLDSDVHFCVECHHRSDICERYSCVCIFGSSYDSLPGETD